MFFGKSSCVPPVVIKEEGPITHIAPLGLEP